MLDFVKISTKTIKKEVVEIYPKFIIKKSSDLMIRGNDFYAVWIEESRLWSTDEQLLINMIDFELAKFAEEYKKKSSDNIKVLYMWDAESGIIDRWHKYVEKQMRDNFVPLDESLIFANHETSKTDYASKKLNYNIGEGSIDGYEKIMSTLYLPEERHKIEWSIGSIVNGASRDLQKFVVLYGAFGTGKSTVINIIEKLFKGYYTVFDAKVLGSNSSSFPLEAFKSNPLVAIQHDGDLSRIEDNTRLNSLVSHEIMNVNEKYKSTYPARFKTFLFLGTNYPVKITDSKSGLLRRLIDVKPSGKRVPFEEYKQAVSSVDFELGAIAYRCKKIFEENPNFYNDYIPVSMLGATNDFYNFIVDSYQVFKDQDDTTLKAAWEMYKTYCEDARVPYPMSQRIFKEELKNYFTTFKERHTEGDIRLRNYYIGFKYDKFESKKGEELVPIPYKVVLDQTKSILDIQYSDCQAQYANEQETPKLAWDEVETTLEDLDTKKLHYVRLPVNHIVIDFDIKNDNGEKDMQLNLEAASKMPPTYAELSKGGGGVHLHYLYTGDVEELSPLYDIGIEVKTFTGKSALRRRLSRCNDIPISTIGSGLPRKEKNVYSNEIMMTEQYLRNVIVKALRKEIAGSTTENINFIDMKLREMYDSGKPYDVSDMRNAIIQFATSSTNQARKCISVTNNMKFKSEFESNNKDDSTAPIMIFDIEVLPNLLLLCYKEAGEGKEIFSLFNPTKIELEHLFKTRLIGFNCRRYDNHILYARYIGYTTEQLHELSRAIMNKDGKHGRKDIFFREAYNLSYTDVYDFSKKKQSLKKWELDLKLEHKEMDVDWDQPLPKEKWAELESYCKNDVIATEAVWNKLQPDFMARSILADMAGLTVNDTTNTLTTKIIFGNNRTPQGQFNYRFLGDIPESGLLYTYDEVFGTDGGFAKRNVNLDEENYSIFNEDGLPVFPGYTYDRGKSYYRDILVGEGGYVYAKPGIYTDVKLFDIEAMHPSSIIAENFFGNEYTARYKELKDVRVAIKENDFDKARKMLGGMLAKYLTDESSAKDISEALKIAINSVYGLTCATFNNTMRDPKNIDNFVAKRGALFMVNLQHELEERGANLIHIKTDSIKLSQPTDEIIKFIHAYAELYGYKFKHEATYEKICLINDAVYIAKEGEEWTATGAQFKHPYVFKYLFSKEPISIDDMIETKSVSGNIFLDFNEDLPDVSDLEEVKSIRTKRPDWMYEIQELMIVSDGKLKKKDDKLLAAYIDISDEELQTKIDEGHNYVFVGKVGAFLPVIDGTQGGLLMRKDPNTGKYTSVSNTIGYRWREASSVLTLGLENDIDRDYYTKLINESIEDISKYDDYNFDWFVS